MEDLHQKGFCFTNKKRRKKDNFIVSLLNQLPKQTECMTSLNDKNRFSNNGIGNNDSNNDSLSHENNSYANENNNSNYSSSDNNKNSHINNSLDNYSNVEILT